MSSSGVLKSPAESSGADPCCKPLFVGLDRASISVGLLCKRGGGIRGVAALCDINPAKVGRIIPGATS